MSILIDDREPEEISRHISSYGLSPLACRLDFGDCSFLSSAGLVIGFERKRLPDLISSMQDRRLSGHQLRGMYTTYDRIELVIEGLWRPNSTGAIEQIGYGNKWQPLYHRGAGISYRQVDAYLYSLAECGNVKVSRTGSTLETAHLYCSRYHWWQKDYDLHRSHDQIYSNDPQFARKGRASMHSGAPNDVTMVAAQMPGVDAKAWDIGQQFTSPREMANATEERWQQVTWSDRKGNKKRFGKKTAREMNNWWAGKKT